MTYTEAARVAEEAARKIRNNDAERIRLLEQLERARIVIAAAISIDPVHAEPESPPPVDNVVALMDPVPVAFEGEDAA